MQKGVIMAAHSGRYLWGQRGVAHTECAELQLGDAIPSRAFYFRYLHTGNMEADNCYVRLVLVGSDEEELPVVRFCMDECDVYWDEDILPGIIEGGSLAAAWRTAVLKATPIAGGRSLRITAEHLHDAIHWHSRPTLSFVINKPSGGGEARDWETILTTRLFES